GVVEQTRRHAAIAALLRVPHVVLAVNKMDLVGYEAKEFDRIVEDFAAHAAELDLPGFTPIPVSALVGDNVVDRSAHMDWYEGPTLLEHLESVRVGGDPSGQPARFPVQYVIRHGERRHYAGQLASGSLRVGDRVTIHPSGGSSEIEAIDVLGEEVREAYAPQSLALRLADPLDVSRGDMITSGADAPALTRDVRAAVCHLADRPLRVGDRVLVRHTTRTVKAIVKDLTDGRGSHPDRATSGTPGAPGGQGASGVELSANDLGRITLRTAEPLALDDYARCRRTGAFILVDPADGATLTAGMVDLTEAGSPTWAPMT
ncbi:elongation factor 1-alpha C-terminal domain-related protein, partial [Streptomyces aurantiacus]|uniref:elongation factor 1-alpha C-terminal domain-related protein n=2 Tax=Streptomyces aurantiacus TaxID=47760 RepID=UPI0034045997